MLESQKLLVKSTLPALREHGETIAQIFYKDLLETNPEMRSMFSSEDQQNGFQAKRLAGAILAYVGNLDRLDLLGPAVMSISRRHVQTHVTAEQYPIVEKHLLHAIKAVLGDEATPMVMDAWAAAYAELADIMIQREKLLYAEQAAAPPS